MHLLCIQVYFIIDFNFLKIKAAAEAKVKVSNNVDERSKDAQKIQCNEHKMNQLKTSIKHEEDGMKANTKQHGEEEKMEIEKKVDGSKSIGSFRGYDLKVLPPFKLTWNGPANKQFVGAVVHKHYLNSTNKLVFDYVLNDKHTTTTDELQLLNHPGFNDYIYLHSNDPILLQHSKVIDSIMNEASKQINRKPSSNEQRGMFTKCCFCLLSSCG